MVKKITSAEFEKIDMNGVVVVDFSATWCGPCKMLAPVLEDLSNDLDGKASFYNVDVDENPDLAQKFMITNIPALLILKNGEKQEMPVGFQPKEALNGIISKYL